jgi:hypothetical protein
MIQNFLLQKGNAVTLEQVNDFLHLEKTTNIVLDKNSEFNSLKIHFIRLRDNNNPYKDIPFNDFYLFHNNLDQMYVSNYWILVIRKITIINALKLSLISEVIGIDSVYKLSKYK